MSKVSRRASRNDGTPNQPNSPVFIGCCREHSSYLTNPAHSGTQVNAPRAVRTNRMSGGRITERAARHQSRTQTQEAGLEFHRRTYEKLLDRRQATTPRYRLTTQQDGVRRGFFFSADFSSRDITRPHPIPWRMFRHLAHRGRSFDIEIVITKHSVNDSARARGGA